MQDMLVPGSGVFVRYNKWIRVIVERGDKRSKVCCTILQAYENPNKSVAKTVFRRRASNMGYFIRATSP